MNRTSVEESITHIARHYDQHVAGHYDQDPFRICADSRQAAVAQLRKVLTAERMNILDLGCGTGNLLIEMRDLFPESELYGIDVSRKMIEIAREKFLLENAPAITTFCDDVCRADRYIQAATMDLVAMHFLLNYVNHRRVLSDASMVLKKGGLLSVLTTTKEAFPIFQMLARKICGETLVKFFMRLEMRAPKDSDTLLDLLGKCGFEILESRILEKKIRFESLDEFSHFLFRSGWCTSQIILKLAKKRIEAERAYLETYLPVEDTVKISVILARKT